MPTKTWIATTASTWGTAASWSPSGVPTSSDDVIFNSTYSGDCTQGTTGATCKSLVMTGYTGTFSGTSTLSIAGGDGSVNNYALILSAAGTTANFTYSGTITFSGTGSYSVTTNGKIFSGNLAFNSSAAGAWNVTDYLQQNEFTVSGSMANITLTRGSLTFAGSNGIKIDQTGISGTVADAGGGTGTVFTPGTAFGASLYGAVVEVKVGATSLGLGTIAEDGSTLTLSAATSAGSKTISIYREQYNASIGAIVSTGSLARTITFDNLELKGGLNALTTNSLVWSSSGATNFTINGGKHLHLTSTTVGRKFVQGHTSASFGDLYLKGDGEFIGVISTGSTFENIYVTCEDPATYFYIGPSITVNGNIDLSGSTGCDWRAASNPGTITIYGNLIFSESVTFNVCNPIIFTGTGTQTVTFNGNQNSYLNTITVNKADGTFSFTDAFKSTSNFTLTAGAVLSAYNLNFSGITLNGGTFTQNSGTIAYTGTLTNGGATSIFNTTVSGTTSANLTVSSGSVQFSNTSPNLGTVSIDGTVTQSGGTLTFHGISTLTGSTNLSGGTMTIAVGSTYTQSVSGTAITLSGTGNLVIEDDCTINRFTFSGGSSLVINNNPTISIAGSTSTTIATWAMTTPPSSISGLNNCTLKFTSTSTTGTTIFSGGGLTYGTVWFNRINTTAANRVLDSNTFYEFIDGNTYGSSQYNILAHSIQFGDSSTQTFSKFTVNGTSSTKRIVLTSVSGGTYTLTNASSPLTQFICYYVDVRYSQGSPYVLDYNWSAKASKSTSVSGWEIADTRYWVGGTGTWNTSSGNWAVDSGGSPTGISAPTSTVDAVFDENSGSGSVTTSSATCLSFICTNSTVSIVGSATISIYGDASVGSALSTYTGALAFYFANKTVRFNPGDTPLSCDVSILSGANGTVMLTNHLNIYKGYLRLASGTLNTSDGTQSYNVTCKYFYADGALASYLYMNSSTFTTTGRASDTSATYAWNVSNVNAGIDGGTSTLIITGTELLDSPPTSPASARVVYIRLCSYFNTTTNYYWNVYINRGSHTGETSFTDGIINIGNELRDLGTASHTINFPDITGSQPQSQVGVPYFLMSAPAGSVFTLDCFTTGGSWGLAPGLGWPQFAPLNRVAVKNSISYRTGSTVTVSTGSTLTNTTGWEYSFPLARPFAYNIGSAITGTTQVGNLAVGTPTEGFGSTGLAWWMGPDEDLGYVVAIPRPLNNQSTPVSGVTASLAFYRSVEKTEPSFISLVNRNFSQNFASGAAASAWLTANGYWNNWT